VPCCRNRRISVSAREMKIVVPAGSGNFVGDITRQTSTPTSVILRNCSQVEVPVERRGSSHRFGCSTTLRQCPRQRQRAHSFLGLSAPLGDLRRARARELLESRGKARNNSTTAAGARSIIAVLYASGEDCRLAELECAVRQPVCASGAQKRRCSHTRTTTRLGRHCRHLIYRRANL